MRKTKRIVSLLVCIAMMLAILPTVSLAAKYEFDVDTTIEFEDCKISKNSTLDEVKLKSASGGKYLNCVRSGNNNDPDSADPELTFTLNVPADGLYYIWFRYGANGKNSDSLFINFDDEKMNSTSVQIAVLTEGEGFYWQVIKKQNLSKGVHTVKVTPREPGMRFDCLYITSDRNYKPQELIEIEKIEAEEKAKAEAEAAEVAKTGIYFNNKAPVFEADAKTGGVVFEAEKMLLDKDLGAGVKESETAGDGKVLTLAKILTEVPVSSPGAAEAFVKVNKAGTYYVWMRYAAATNANDSVFFSYNGSLYTSSHEGSTSFTGAADTYKWVKIHTFADVKVGDKLNLRIFGRENEFVIDQIVVTCNKSFMPGGIVTEVFGDDKLQPIEIDASIYSKPPRPNTTEHPRVLVTKDDIPKIKANLGDYENRYAYELFQKYLNMDIKKGVLPDTVPNNDDAILEGIHARAFDYLINGNVESGKQAVEGQLNYLKTVVWPTEGTVYGWKGYTMYVAAIVYDWCYDLMTDDERGTLLTLCELMSAGNEIGFPPNAQGSVTGHGSEYQFLRDWVALAIAVADEYPDVYDFVIGRVYDEYVEPRKFWYASETHHQGTSYGSARYASDLWCEYLLAKIGQKEIFGADIRNCYYQMLYMMRADGQYLRIGDTFDDGAIFWRSRQKNAAFLTANMYKDPYMKRAHAIADPTYTGAGTGYDGIPFVMWLILNDPTIEEKDIGNLPMSKYFGSPDGSIIARTGWDYGMESESAIAYMNIGEVWAANHDHRDAGSFQLYYKGILASDAGSYIGYNYAENGINYDNTYYKATIAHNALLIYNPNETMPSATTVNTGGQKQFGGEAKNFSYWMSEDQYRTGYVTAHEIDDSERVPRYNYISGDITKAYGEKAEEVRRSMLFMPTNDATKPAVFFVMDKITSADASYEKYWLLHPMYEPKIDGNMMVIENTKLGNSGQLVNTTLYPKDIKVEVYGGETENQFKNFQITDKSRWSEGAEINQWRIDVTPAQASKTDYFLNAMYVADTDNNIVPEKAELVETNDMLGAVLSDRAALFVKDGANKVSEQSFTLPARENLAVFVSGLVPGNYEVTENGNVIANVIATKDGGCIYFDANGGDYTIRNTDVNATRIVGTPPEGNSEVQVTVLYAGKPVYCDVPARVVNDRTLIPFRALFEAMQCTVEWDAESMTATATDGVTTIVLKENDNTAYVNGVSQILDVPAQIMDGRFLVPLRFVGESMGSDVSWDEFGQFVNVSETPTSIRNKILNEFGIENVIGYDVVARHCGENGEFDTTSLTDGNISTYIAPFGGEEGDAWFVMDLGAEYSLEKVNIAFYNAGTRTFKFDLLVSTDGVNYTNVYDDEVTEMSLDTFFEYDLGGVKARYVKYVGLGNTKNKYNSIKEIFFSEQK